MKNLRYHRKVHAINVIIDISLHTYIDYIIAKHRSKGPSPLFLCVTMKIMEIIVNYVPSNKDAVSILAVTKVTGFVFFSS